MAKTTNGRMTRREILRRQQEADERRKRLIKVIAIVVAVVVVIAVVAVVVTKVSEKRRQDAIAGDASAQIKPPNLTADGSAIIADPGAANAALTIDIHEDFQCPICKQAEDAFGSAFDQIVANNQALVRYHIRSFLDVNERNNASSLAAIGATCADTVGKFDSYHDTVYAHQPAVEGTGYTDEQLGTQFAQEAGITGADLTKFQQCYNNRQTSQVVQNMESINLKAGVDGTPAFFANGKSVSLQTLSALTSTDAATVLATFQKAAGLS